MGDIEKDHGRNGQEKVFVRVFGEGVSLSEPRWVDKVIKPLEVWKAELGVEAFEITRKQGTEAPFCGPFLNHKKDGFYLCVACQLPLFSSDSKFKSGTGWPSFFMPIADENVYVRVDKSHGMVRQEIVCRLCDAHLGHVFEDGPPPTGKRYCLNGKALTFVEKRQDVPESK